MNTKRVENTKYRLLTYTLTADVEDGTLLYNVITGELVLLDREEVRHLSTLPCDYAPWMDVLIQENFLIPEEYEDKNAVDFMRLIYRQVTRKNGLDSCVILPTTVCNARCFYCFEAGVAHSTMSDEIADQVVEYIAAHRGGNDLYIRWFGGEPLVGAQEIDRICHGLKEKGITFRSEMVSNAYLFDEKTVKRAKELWKVYKVRVTIDGTEKVYNQVKAYAHSCENPYQRVLKNIELLQKAGILVTIRLNLGMYNVDDMFSLVKELGEYYKDKTGLHVNSVLLFDNCGPAPMHLTSNESKLLTIKQRELSELIVSLGLARPNYVLPILRANSCYADNDASIVFLPNGKLTKCEHYIDRHTVGDIKNGITNQAEVVAAFHETAYAPHCYTCPLYPSCIKLKLCEADRPCRDAEMLSHIRDTEKAMKFIYEKEKNDNEDEV